jgi:hypothetical protein
MFEFFAINRYLDTARRYYRALINFYGPQILNSLPREEERGRKSCIDVYVRGLVQSGKGKELTTLPSFGVLFMCCLCLSLLFVSEGTPVHHIMLTSWYCFVGVSISALRKSQTWPFSR